MYTYTIHTLYTTLHIYTIHKEFLLLSYLHVYFPGSQATVATTSVAVGNTTFQFLQLCSSTPLKRKAVPPDGPPPKRPLLEFPSFQESEISSNFADPDESTYLPSMSELVDTTSEH